MNTRKPELIPKVRKSRSSKPKSGVSRRRKNSSGSPSDRWLRQRRADLMSRISDAEKSAYKVLSRLGYKIIRQYPINTGRKQYFADLYVPSLRCIIEIDGGYHYSEKQRRLDKNRSSGLWRLGYHVLRLSNRDARNPDKIVKKLRLIKK